MAEQQIFISYARNDQGLTDRIRVALEQAGFVVWQDTSNLRGGEDFPTEVEQAILSSAALVVVLSASSADSSWVSREVDLALSTDGRVTVVPVLIDDDHKLVRLEDIHHIDLRAIRHAIGAEVIAGFQTAMSDLVTSLNKLSPIHALLRRLESTDPEEREAAAFDAATTTTADEVVTRLSEIVESADEAIDVRFEAANALGKMGDRRAVAALHNQLGDPNPDIIAASVRALGMLGATDSIEDIRLLLEQAEDRFVRESAARALGRLGATGHLSALIHRMRNDPISDVRDAAAESIWHIYEIRRLAGEDLRRALKALQRGGYSLDEVKHGWVRAEEVFNERTWAEVTIDIREGQDRIHQIEPT